MVQFMYGPTPDGPNVSIETHYEKHPLVAQWVQKHQPRRRRVHRRPPDWWDFHGGAPREFDEHMDLMEARKRRTVEVEIYETDAPQARQEAAWITNLCSARWGQSYDVWAKKLREAGYDLEGIPRPPDAPPLTHRKFSGGKADCDGIMHYANPKTTNQMYCPKCRALYIWGGYGWDSWGKRDIPPEQLGPVVLDREA